MKLLDRLFGKPAKEVPPADLGIALAPLLEEITTLLDEIAGEAIDPDVVRARLADTLRDHDVEPVDPAELDAVAAALDEGAWMRLELLTRAASRGALGDYLPARVGMLGASLTVRLGFLSVAVGAPLLTLELLRQSGLRREELARGWLASLGVPVAGEAPEASRDALARLDYGRLLADVDSARKSAEERMAYLKKLQDEHDASLPRRGKW